MSKKHKNDTQKKKRVDQGSELKSLRGGLVIPNATVFVGSLCIMALELTAGRLIAGFLGFSIYTWTSVIGVVLAGIAIGNYIGGRLADKYQPQPILVVLFFSAAIGCIIIPFLNQAVGNMLLYVSLYWPAKILLHVTAIFLLPSALLGMISPVVAKWALDQGLRVGRTIGDVYAWSAVGSIAGTFLTGFFLIPFIGTSAIIGSIAGVLACLGLIFYIKGKAAPSAFGFAFALLICAIVGSQVWSMTTTRSSMAFSEINPELLYEQESQYSYIRVETIPGDPDMRLLRLDSLEHSKVNLNDPTDLSSSHQYGYIKFYGAMTDLLAGEKEYLRTYFLGGGGYVMPRYVAKKWPKSYIEVAEIDPAVTETAIKELGLSSDHSMNIAHMDVRNHIDDLLRQRREGGNVGDFDLIYGDTFNDVTVPFQLTTLEFNKKLSQLLAPGGVYMLNLVDAMDSGKFVGATINTLKQTFPYIKVFSATEGRSMGGDWNTFILVCSLNPLDLEFLNLRGLSINRLDTAQTEQLVKFSKGMILTDNYVPVDYLLSAMTQKRGQRLDNRKIGHELIRDSVELVKQGKVNAAIVRFRKVIKISPELAEGAHYNIGTILSWSEKFDEAIDEYQKVLDLNPQFEKAHIGIAKAFVKLEKTEEAMNHLTEVLKINPNSIAANAMQGDLQLNKGEYAQAITHYRTALQLDPQDVNVHSNLGLALYQNNDVNEAIEQFKKALDIDPNFGPAQKNFDLALKRQKNGDIASQDSDDALNDNIAEKGYE